VRPRLRTGRSAPFGGWDAHRATGGRTLNSLYTSRPGAGTLPCLGGGHGNLRFLPARRPNTVAKIVAQGQWRVRPA